MTDLFQTNDLPTIDPEKDYFSEFVGEGKKYADPKAAGRALAEKDLFIERLKRENAGVRQELATRASLEDIAKKIDEKVAQPPQSPPNHGDDRREPEPKAVSPDPKDLEAKIAELINQRERQNALQSNERLVHERLRKAYGDNYQLRVSQEAEKLGVGTDFLSGLAREQPNAFFKLLGVDEERRPQQDIPAPQNTFRPTGGSTGEKTFYGYYDLIRQKDPVQYWSPRVQNEMMKQLEELGQEAFYRK